MPVPIPLNLNELEEICNKYDTPYYLYDEQSIKKNARHYMKTFQKYFPDFKQYYAVKALPNPSILKILKICGIDFDCSSLEEIQIVELVDKYSDKPSDIMYTSNYTSESDLEWVLDNSVNTIINLDSIDCFHNLLDASNHINVDLPDTISFRYNPIMIDGEFDTTDITHIQNTKKLKNQLDKNNKINADNNIIKSNNFSGENTKFGMTFKYILEAYNLAKDNNIKKFGIHVMPHSNCMDIEYWSKLIDHMFQVIFEISSKLNINITFMDIGGGIGIPYKPGQKDIILEDLVKMIRERFDYNTQYYEIIEPQLMTECGRYITGSHGWLISKCQSIKETDRQIFYGLDASMANLMRPGMYEAYHHITIPRLQNYFTSPQMREANVVGTLCENNDWFAKNRDLPSGIKKGDLFVIHDCGAHAYSMGFNYNSKLHCPEILIKKNGIEEIRKKETIDYHLQNTLIHQKHKRNINVLIGVFCLMLYFILYYFFSK
jgi:diaminopimelate decarboxylase